MFKDNRDYFDEVTIKAEFISYFNNFFMEMHWERPSATNLHFDQLTQIQRGMLEKDLEEEGSGILISRLGHNKSLGPNSFSREFVQLVSLSSS